MYHIIIGIFQFVFLACLYMVIVEASPFSTIEAKFFHVILYKVHTIKTIKIFSSHQFFPLIII